MLTSYCVKCPRPECSWSGILLPEHGGEIWKAATPTTTLLVFHCPRCGVRWHKQIVHDDLAGKAEIESESLACAPQ